MKLDSAAFVADPGLLHALEERAMCVDCGEERVLFRQGDEPNGLYILHDGAVTLSMQSPSGNTVLKMPAAPGSLLGLPGLIGNHNYTLSAEAQKGAHVSFVSKEVFSRLMLTEPSVSVGILRVLAAEVRTARQAMSDLKSH